MHEKQQFFLEIYAGCARLTGAVAQKGLAWGPPLELENGAWFDVHDARVFRQILRWIELGRIWCVHLGTPCTFWSVTTAKKDKHRVVGLRAVRQTCKIIDACNAHGVYWTLENPKSSALWKYGPLLQRIHKPDVLEANYDCCEYRQPYKKPTKVVGTLPTLVMLSRQCKGGHYHEHLQGSVTIQVAPNSNKSMWRTKLAGKYPPSLCRLWAQALALAAPKTAWLTSGADGEACAQKWEARLRAVTSSTAEYTPAKAPACPRGHCPPWPDAAPSWGKTGRWVPKL